MKETAKIVINLSFTLLLALMPFLNARAVEVNNPINEYDSIYRYNALENKVSFRDLVYNLRIKANKGREFHSRVRE